MTSVAYLVGLDSSKAAKDLLLYGRTGPSLILVGIFYKPIAVPLPLNYKFIIFGFYWILIGNFIK